eukprot:10675216-Lingulodinium_polyedra.AAC.1
MRCEIADSHAFACRGRASQQFRIALRNCILTRVYTVRTRFNAAVSIRTLRCVLAIFETQTRFEIALETHAHDPCFAAAARFKFGTR